MTAEETILEMLKVDLSKMNPDPATIEYLNQLISVAEAEIQAEGIKLNLEDISHMQTVEMYAAYLYRKRASSNSAMPRMLRYRMNNLLFGQKCGGRDGQ